MADAKWIVHTKGGPDQSGFEIAVLRENNSHGIASYGWFGSNKLLISHSGGPCRSPVTRDTWAALMVAAEIVADKLNAAAGVGIPRGSKQ